MSTYTFTKTDNQIQVNNYIDRFPGDYKIEGDNNAGTVLIRSLDGKLNLNIFPAQDTVIINEEEFSGTPSELVDELYEHIFTGPVGASGSFTTVDEKTVTVVNGIITAIEDTEE